jgi:hypothetical protein
MFRSSTMGLRCKFLLVGGSPVRLVHSLPPVEHRKLWLYVHDAGQSPQDRNAYMAFDGCLQPRGDPSLTEHGQVTLFGHEPRGVLRENADSAVRTLGVESARVFWISSLPLG